jgi:phosphatidylcholine synthase
VIVAANRLARLAAAGVHVFTGLGAVCGLFAALAAFDAAWERMFVWLGIALVIDGIDGSFARLTRVEERLPRFSGERLDLVVDYVTYVFVPALALERAGYIDGAVGLVFAAAILLSSLFHFSDLASKDDDYSFVGFPAIWNVVAFYVFAFAMQQWAAYAVIGACVVLTFVPMRWAHPLRVTRLRWLTLAVTAGWAAAAIATVATGFPATGWSRLMLAVAAVYLIGLTLSRPRHQGRTP